MTEPADPTQPPEKSGAAPSRQLVHDLNNLLNVIRGYSELLLEETDDADPVHKDLRTIFEAAQRAAELASKL
jgi:signal transduction histidine kinase